MRSSVDLDERNADVEPLTIDGCLGGTQTVVVHQA